MREILFKAKRIDTGEWKYGSLINLPNGETEIANKCVNPPDSDPMWKKCVITHEVDPETLCQYTGLADKNGKKIWESDIVRRADLHKVGEPSIGIIEYDIENTAFVIHWIDNPKYSPTYPWKNKIEVAGNIFDNPELLDGSTD